jgi:lipopolysaccharide transport system permease protein
MEDREEDWTLIIQPKEKLFHLNLSELKHYRDLIGLLVRRDFVSVYKQTILGPLWFIIQPLITTVMYMFVFGNIAKISTDNIPQPLFYFSGTMLWTFFSNNLTKTADTFISNANLFGKIYFPRFTVPIAYTITNSFTLGIQAAVLVVFYLYYVFSGISITPNLWLCVLPILVIQLAMLGVGLGIMISALTTKYRDLKNLVGFGMQLWMYATPIVYPLSQVPERWRWVYIVNPVSPIIETFRFALLGKGNPHFSRWMLSLVFSVLIFVCGIIVFNRNERTFIDVV